MIEGWMEQIVDKQPIPGYGWPHYTEFLFCREFQVSEEIQYDLQTQERHAEHGWLYNNTVGSVHQTRFACPCNWVLA